MPAASLPRRHLLFLHIPSITQPIPGEQACEPIDGLADLLQKIEQYGGTGSGWQIIFYDETAHPASRLASLKTWFNMHQLQMSKAQFLPINLGYKAEITGLIQSVSALLMGGAPTLQDQVYVFEQHPALQTRFDRYHGEYADVLVCTTIQELREDVLSAIHEEIFA